MAFFSYRETENLMEFSVPYELRHAFKDFFKMFKPRHVTGPVWRVEKPSNSHRASLLRRATEQFDERANSPKIREALQRKADNYALDTKLESLELALETISSDLLAASKSRSDIENELTKHEQLLARLTTAVDALNNSEKYIETLKRKRRSNEAKIQRLLSALLDLDAVEAAVSEMVNASFADSMSSEAMRSFEQARETIVTAQQKLHDAGLSCSGIDELAQCAWPVPALSVSKSKLYEVALL